MVRKNKNLPQVSKSYFVLRQSQSYETILTWVMKFSFTFYLALAYNVLCFTWYKNNLFSVMSDQNFVFFDQDGVLVGNMSFQEKKIVCSSAWTLEYFQ